MTSGRARALVECRTDRAPEIIRMNQLGEVPLLPCRIQYTRSWQEQVEGVRTQRVMGKYLGKYNKLNGQFEEDEESLRKARWICIICMWS